MIEEFKDELKSLKNILNEIKNTRTIERTRNKSNKKWNKKKVKYVRWWNNRYIKLDVDLTTLILKCKFFEKPYEYDFIKKERELRILAKKWINEIERLKEEAENNKNELLDDLLESENKIFKLLTDLEYEKHSALNDIAALESKLIKLEISPERIDRIKILITNVW